MPQSPETSFSLRASIEQQPMRDLGVQQFLRRWCSVNDGIEPVFVSREEWLKKQETGILTHETKKQSRRLYLPTDLQLWEMIDVVQTIDNDTYSGKPEQALAQSRELHELSQELQHAAVYIAKRIDALAQGKAVAEALAEELYAYGAALETKTKPEHVGWKEIQRLPLSAEATEQTDIWLAGHDLYEKRRAQVVPVGGQSEDVAREEMRKKTLAQFFRAVEKAMQLQQKFVANEDATRPITSPHESFLQKVHDRLERQIEKPRTEMMSAVFRRGLEKLLHDVNDPAGTADWRVPVDRFFKKFGWDLKLSEKKLRESLHIEVMKQELQEVRRSGDKEKIAAKERECALRIQEAVSQLTYEKECDNATDISALQKVNCVGYTSVGATLQREVGLQFLIVDQPGHTTSFLVTSDDRVYTEEMQHEEQVEITDADIAGTLVNGQQVHVKHLVDMSREKGMHDQIMFELTSKATRNVYEFAYTYPTRPYIMLAYHPDIGLPMSVMNNARGALHFAALDYEMIGEANRDAHIARTIHGTEFIPSNNNFYAAAKEAQRAMYRLVGDQAMHHTRWKGVQKVNKDDDQFREQRFIERATGEKRKTAIDLLRTAHDLRHKGYLEDALQKYQKFLSLLDVKNDEEIMLQVQKYVAELEQALKK